MSQVTDSVLAPLESTESANDVSSCQHSPDYSRIQRWLLSGISFYQKGREGRPSPCRFWPSCSHYATEAVQIHGAGRGSWLTLRRLIRCRPFGPSGVDPVPYSANQSREI